LHFVTSDQQSQPIIIVIENAYFGVTVQK